MCGYNRLQWSPGHNWRIFLKIFFENIGKPSKLDKCNYTYDLLKGNPEDISNLNRPITSNKMKDIIKSPLQEKPGGFSAEVYQTLKEELIEILNLFHEIESEKTLPNWI